MGYLARKVSQNLGQQVLAGNGGQPQANLAFLGIPHILDFPEDFLVPFQHGLAAGQVHLSGLGQGNPALPPDEQLCPGFCFQVPDDPAQGGLGNEQLPGGRGDIPCLGGFYKVLQLFFVKHGSSFIGLCFARNIT